MKLKFPFCSRGSRAVFQFYPESPDQIELITTQGQLFSIIFLYKTYRDIYFIKNTVMGG